MKISGGQADAFCRRDHPELAAVLLFGNDGGLVSERAKQLTTAAVGVEADASAIERLDKDAFQEAGGGLVDRANQFSLISQRRVIIVPDAADALKSQVEALSAAGGGDCLVILTARELRPSSALRKLCESKPNLAAVNCYADDARALSQVIRDWARGLGRPLDQDAAQLLEAQLGANRLLTRSELDKLSLYLASEPDGAPIKREAVLACFSDVKKVELSDPIVAAFDAKPARCLSAATALRNDGKSPDAMLAVFNGHLTKLIEIQALIAEGRSPADAVAALKPPVFFALKPTMIAQSQRWRNATQLRQLAVKSAETLEKIRYPQVDAWSEIERLLIAVCDAGRPS